MEHKKTLEEIEEQKFECTIALASEGGETKQLKLVLDKNIISFAVEHWKDRACADALSYDFLDMAIQKYNEI